MSDDNYRGVDHILRLPSAPVYFNIMKTLNGKPLIPIWLSFKHKEGLTMENENVSSTFIALSEKIGGLTDSEGDKVVRHTIDGKSYNIYLPGKDSDFQIAFVVVFENKDTILIEDKYREELMRKIVDKLSKHKEFRDYISSEDTQITPDMQLYQDVKTIISDVMISWDKKRVKYIKKKEEEERNRLRDLAKKEVKEDKQ